MPAKLFYDIMASPEKLALIIIPVYYAENGGSISERTNLESGNEFIDGFDV